MPEIPQIGKTCPALTKENYDYHLSGDCSAFCICMLTNKQCLGVVVDDPDDQSSRFFSRAKCMIDENRLKRCPIYGIASKKTISTILKDKTQKELNEKLKKLS